jgi:hypothetical protein
LGLTTLPIGVIIPTEENMNKYIINYKLGSTYGKIYVEAHDKIQAATIARIQVQCSNKSRAKFTPILVLEEGEANPYEGLDEKFLTKNT